MASPRPSVLAMAVLSMLTEEPMHAYRLQQLIKERHKDDVVNVSQRNSVYQSIQRLLRDRLVEVESTRRSDNRPERTIYTITPIGRQTLRSWLRSMLATPAREYPSFPAALSFLPSLSRAEAVEALAERADQLRDAVAAVESELKTPGLTRLFLIESELLRDVLTAELAFVRGLVEDLHAQRLDWPDPA